MHNPKISIYVLGMCHSCYVHAMLNGYSSSTHKLENNFLETFATYHLSVNCVLPQQSTLELYCNTA